MNLFVSDAWAQAPAAAPSAGAGLEGLIFPLALLAVLYFVMIRPQMKRQKEHKAMVEGLKQGDEVQSTGGLMGTLVEVGENFVRVEIATGVVVKVRRNAIEVVMPKGSLKDL